MRDFSRASSELQLIARNRDWFIALFVPVVIGRSNCFGFGFSTVFENRPKDLTQFDATLISVLLKLTQILNSNFTSFTLF